MMYMPCGAARIVHKGPGSLFFSLGINILHHIFIVIGLKQTVTDLRLIRVHIGYKCRVTVYILLQRRIYPVT